ncbi:hypothetical protein JQ506_07770 [Shinella sp. PSBB067]|uniref:hypothetical protein n=1 Tax=Shinella sp. PSBB067 TaxID=2715959 RepID=UPI00193B08BC|nr:hypothetical protein [Shinella sp. PSBB067]QRI64878.1 hypothetical protein JQ506_07770 [Shinella sp. PSBB067]
MLKDLECYVNPPQGVFPTLVITGALVDGDGTGLRFKLDAASGDLSLIPGDTAVFHLSDTLLDLLHNLVRSTHDLQHGGIRAHYSFEDCKEVVGLWFDGALGLDVIVATDAEAEWVPGPFRSFTYAALEATA